MTKDTQSMRRFGRAATGVAVTVVAGAAVLALQTLPTPEVIAEPQGVVVDTSSAANHSVVCSGSFAELGADPAQPNLAVPQGRQSVVANSEQTRSLAREAGGEEQAGAVYTAGATAQLTAAATQQLESETVSGLIAYACQEPSSDQWLVGGKTTTGNVTTVTVSNPAAQAATVTLEVYGSTGIVGNQTSSGIVVPAGQSRTIAVNGIVTDEEQLAVRVKATGAAVVATLGTYAQIDIRAVGADTVASQGTPLQRLVIPGVKAVLDGQGDSDAGATELQELVLLAPSEAGQATVRAIRPDGTAQEIARVDLIAGIVTKTPLANWPDDAIAAEISADVAVVGAVESSVLGNGKADMVWYSPAEELQRGDETAVAAISGGELVLVNSGDSPASVKLLAADGSETELTLPAGGGTVAKPPSSIFTIQSPAGVYAGVRILADGGAAYPVPPAKTNSKNLTVYTQ